MYLYLTMLLLQGGVADADTTMIIEDASSSVNLFSILMDGGILMIPIGLLWILAIYVIAERWRFLNNSQMDNDQFLSSVEDMLRDGNTRQAVLYCDQMDKPLSRILKQGITRLGRPLVDIEDAIKSRFTCFRISLFKTLEIDNIFKQYLNTNLNNFLIKSKCRNILFALFIYEVENR